MSIFYLDTTNIDGYKCQKGRSVGCRLNNAGLLTMFFVWSSGPLVSSHFCQNLSSLLITPPFPSFPLHLCSAPFCHAPSRPVPPCSSPPPSLLSSLRSHMSWNGGRRSSNYQVVYVLINAEWRINISSLPPWIPPSCILAIVMFF